eukprot:COSAG01_NODE_7049_length_3376_cov_32.391822_3_plen_49_part_00
MRALAPSPRMPGKRDEAQGGGGGGGGGGLTIVSVIANFGAGVARTARH